MKYGKAALAAVLSCCLLGVPALAQNNAVKIGVLDDMSGPYAENTGPGDVGSAKMAIADFGGSVLGKPIELVSADFQSKVDVGVGIGSAANTGLHSMLNPIIVVKMRQLI